MKKIPLLVIVLVPVLTFGQGKSISLAKKHTAPYVATTNDTLKVDQQIMVAAGSNPDGSFKYVQLINNINEPVKPAESRFAMKKQEIKFFKEQDGTTYAFTKFFVINVEAALEAKEVKVLK